MSGWFKYFTYASFIFLVLALHKANYLVIPTVYSVYDLAVSFLFLFLSFWSGATCWRMILKKNNYHICEKESLASVGLTVFGKYIPGKVWAIMGRAAYIGQKKSLPIHKLAAISMDAQIITLWIGLVFGAFGLFLLGGLGAWGWSILLLWLVLTLLLFGKFSQVIGKFLMKRIVKKEINFPSLSFRHTLGILPWFVLYWALWTIGFYLLVKSLSDIDVPFSVGFAFPLAGTLGILAIVVPGGLGVREGAIVAYLSLAGLSLTLATSISIASRLWYVIGEISIFMVGWAVSHWDKNPSSQPGITGNSLEKQK